MKTIKIDRKNTGIVAHRGLSGIERENTCAAFVAAGNRSYFGIETDVHIIKDGNFLIIHDDSTDRISEGKVKKEVEKCKYSELADIVLPDKDGSEYRRDIKIPLLKEYIGICKKYEKTCVLELKHRFEKNKIADMIEEIRSMGYLDRVTFISFTLENCIDLKSMLPDNDVQWLYEKEITDETIETLKKYNLNIDVYYKLLTRENIGKLHSNGILINCWTCDDKETAEKLIEYGVDFVTTNILE